MYSGYFCDNRSTLSFPSFPSSGMRDMEGSEQCILYEGDEKGVCIGKIEGGKTKAVCEFDGARKVQAIYLAKSKIGIARIIRFALTDQADSLQK